MEEALQREKSQRKDEQAEMQTVRKQLNELTEREEREIRGKNDKIKQL